MIRCNPILVGWGRCAAMFVFGVALTLSANDTAVAGGSWGGSGGSFGSGGGAWGSGGSVGGSGGGLFGGRRPVRNLLGRIASRFSGGSGGSLGGSRGGSGGSFGGSNGGSAGGSMGSSLAGFGSTGGWGGSGGGSVGGYADSSSGVGYGSWGSSYLGSMSNDYSYASVAAPMYSAPAATYAAPMVSDYSASCPECGISGGMPVNQGVIETDYSADTGFYDGSMPGYEGSYDVQGGVIDPTLSAPEYYDNGSTFDPGISDDGMPPSPGPASSDSTNKVRKMRSVVTRRQRQGKAVLSVELPEEAQVYINNRLTKTKGDIRNYVSRQLQQDRDYSYHVKAVLVRDGKRLVRTQVVKMRTGLNPTLKFDFDQPVKTTLALKVPADAKVRLCGAETKAAGKVRFFETSKLSDGETWDNYEIEVVVDRNGKQQIEKRSLTLQAGETHVVAFDFDDATGKLIAAR